MCIMFLYLRARSRVTMSRRYIDDEELWMDWATHFCEWDYLTSVFDWTQVRGYVMRVSMHRAMNIVYAYSRAKIKTMRAQRMEVRFSTHSGRCQHSLCLAMWVRIGNAKKQYLSQNQHPVRFGRPRNTFWALHFGFRFSTFFPHHIKLCMHRYVRRGSRLFWIDELVRENALRRSV